MATIWSTEHACDPQLGYFTPSKRRESRGLIKKIEESDVVVEILLCLRTLSHRTLVNARPRK